MAANNHEALVDPRDYFRPLDPNLDPNGRIAGLFKLADTLEPEPALISRERADALSKEATDYIIASLHIKN